MAAMTAVFASPSCSSCLSFPHSSSSHRMLTFACSHRPHRFCRGENEQLERVSQKRVTARRKDERAHPPPDSSRGDTRWSQFQSTVFKLFGTDTSDGVVYDLRKQQVDDRGNIQNSSILNAVVKVYCTHSEPDYSLPWQKQKQYTSTGSAFMIGDKMLLTNDHCIGHATQVKVKRRGDDTKYSAKVLARGIECDIALLSVDSEEFWSGTEPLRFGRTPCLQDAVTVVGYPLGGDTISVTKGVVSRIEVTSYTQGSSDLLAIQIDAAINPGNSGGPAFNDHGECIGIAFQVYRSEDVENIGYVIPTAVVSHFLYDYERNAKYTGFPSLGVLLQKLENPALRSCLKVPSNEGVLVRTVEPTSPAIDVLKEGDVIVSFDGVQVGSEGTVQFGSTARIAFRYLISQKFSGDVVDLGIIRDGTHMIVKTVLQPRVRLVPYYIAGQPSFLIIAGLVFTLLSVPLMEEEDDDTIGMKLLSKACYSLARFKDEQIVILTQVLANEVTIGYEDMEYRQLLKFNGIPINNIRHLAHLVDSCKDKYLTFEFDDNFLAVVDRKAAAAAEQYILRDHGIPHPRSLDLVGPFPDQIDQHVEGDPIICPATDEDVGYDALLWA